MDRLDSITVFAKVVETGSFSEAARQTGRSPASVSRVIRDLEGWLGGRVFYRTTRRLSLTEAGENFYSRVKGVLNDLEEARVLAAGAENHPTGTLRLTAPASMGAFVTSAAAAFQEKWPKVDICLSLTDQLVDLVKEGFDMAIRVGRLRDSSLTARKIGEGKRFLCASPGYLAKHGAPKRAKELEGHSCLAFRATPGFNIWNFRAGSNTVSIKASGRFCCNSGPALVSAAQQGLGIILVPDWLARQALEEGSLVRVKLKEALEWPTTPVYILHAYENFVPPKVRLFGDFVKERFAGEMGA